MNNFINSIWSKLLGVIFVLGGSGLLIVGEQITVREYIDLSIFQREIAEVVQTVSATELDITSYQGKLVYITGVVTSNQTLRDDFFAINAKNTLSLRRDVYKYKEHEFTERVWHTVTRPSYTGRYKYKEVEIYENRTWTVVDWTYDKVLFHDSLTLENQLFMADKARLGPFNLPTAMIGLAIIGSSDGSLNEVIALQKIPPQLKDYPIQLRHGEIYMGQNPEKKPQLDDVKISLSKLKPIFVSVLAKVEGNTFVPYITPSGQEINDIETPPDILDDMLYDYKPNVRYDRDTASWTTRLMGAGAFFVGLMLCFSWLARLLQSMPILSRLVTVGYFFAAFSVTAAFVALVVTGTWWVVSPWQSLVGLLVGFIPLGVVLLLGDR